MSSTTFIYALKDPRNSRIRYLGKAVNPNRRLKHHLWTCKTQLSHRDSWIKGLVDLGLKPELELIDEVPLKEWEFWEKEYIRLFKAIAFPLTNLTPGGDGNHNPTPETRAKMRAAKLGIKPTPETRAKLSASAKAKMFTENHRRNLTLSMLGKKRGPMSAEQREKIGASNRGERHHYFGKKLSAEHVAKMRQAHLGQKLSPESIAKREATRAANRALNTYQKDNLCRSESHS